MRLHLSKGEVSAVLCHHGEIAVNRARFNLVAMQEDGSAVLSYEPVAEQERPRRPFFAWLGKKSPAQPDLVEAM